MTKPIKEVVSSEDDTDPDLGEDEILSSDVGIVSLRISSVWVGVDVSFIVLVGVTGAVSAFARGVRGRGKTLVCMPSTLLNADVASVVLMLFFTFLYGSVSVRRGSTASCLLGTSSSRRSMSPAFWTEDWVRWAAECLTGQST